MGKENSRKFAKIEKKMTLKEKTGNLNANHVDSSDKILCFDLIFLLENRGKFNAKSHISVCSWMKKKDWKNANNAICGKHFSLFRCAKCDDDYISTLFSIFIFTSCCSFFQY